MIQKSWPMIALGAAFVLITAIITNAVSPVAVAKIDPRHSAQTAVH